MLKMLNLGLIGAFLAAAPASATQYLFTIDGLSTATGTLTVQDPIALNGGSLITAITGNFNGQAITGLLPINSFGSNDNLLFVAQNPLLDFNGFSFTGSFGNRNVYYQNAYHNFGDPFDNLTFSITAVTAGVPEPATWAMMLIGFGAIGVALRRRRRTSALLQAA